MVSATFILFGATGDLAKRKIFPAIHDLIVEKKIDAFLIVGVSIASTTVEDMLRPAEQFISRMDHHAWDMIKQHSFYYQLDVTDASGFGAVHALVEQQELERNLSGNRMIYCATAADFFCDITRNSCAAGIIQKKQLDQMPWHRIVYEKPFGHDLQSAYAINECIKDTLYEHQVFRIDHYLSKEIVSNIALLRFTNIVLEPLWNNIYIDQVHIVLSEDIGIEGRGWYYDRYGAIRDVVQNHALELLALVAMEQPERLTGEHIRTQRARVLQAVECVDGITGQYTGYLQEAGVSDNSATETFALLKLMVDNNRWSGVPFYITSGKSLSKKETTIHIKFKDVECLLLRGCPTDSNWLTLQIAPEAVFSLTLNAKRPGRDVEMVPVDMEFCHSCIFGPRTPQAYQVLLEEIMRGEQSISVRSDEIEYAWNIVSGITALQLPLYQYDIGTNGPKEIRDFSKQHNIRWKK